MNSNYFTRCSSINYTVAGGEVVGMEAAVTGRRRTTTHAEEEEAEEEEEDGEEEEEEEDALVAANPDGIGIAHPAIAPFRYLINEQAKSFVVLQELQNEVGALLEFRDLVMETFPHLRQKTGPRLTSSAAQQQGKQQQRDWEPGVRVKRKLHQLHSRDQQHDSLAAPRSRSNSHGKGGGGGGKSASEAAANSGTSSAGSSAVQDSGFCADSSKEHCSTSATSATSAPRKDADDELWNLLDMIHVKGTRLRLQVEHLQQKLDKHERVSPPPPGGFRRRSRSLEIISKNKKKINHAEEYLHAECRLSLESEMRALKQERDLLLDRLADMEAENLANVARTDRLLADMGTLSAEKRHLERQLRAAQAKVASSQRLLVQERSSCFAPVGDAFVESGVAPLSPPSPATNGDNYLKQEDGYRISHRPPDPVSSALPAAATSTPPRLHHRASMRLGTLDGIISSPSPRMKGAKNVTPDKKKTAAILAEFNAVELQRHLLVTTFQNQIANSRIERLSRSYVDIHHQLEKFKEENDDLRFQLEEKSIELEGTRARIRLLERLQSAKYGDASGGRGGGGETVLHPSHESTPNPILPQIALPVTVAVDEANVHHSSSTESAHHDDEEAEEKRTTTTPTTSESPKKRPPSKIPLKSYTAPKPPIGRPAPHKAPTPPHSHRSHDRPRGDMQSMSLGRSKSREMQSMQQPRSRENSAAARTASPHATGTRDSLREPRRTRKTSSNQEASFSSTGSSHSVRTPHSYSTPSSSSSKKPPSTSRDRDRTVGPPGADQGEHKVWPTTKLWRLLRG